MKNLRWKTFSGQGRAFDSPHINGSDFALDNLSRKLGFGLLLPSFAASLQQAMILCVVFLMPFMLLSGRMSPTDNMSEVLKYTTMINPLKYAISIKRRVYLESAGIDTLLPDMLAVTTISAVPIPVDA